MMCKGLVFCAGLLFISHRGRTIQTPQPHFNEFQGFDGLAIGLHGRKAAVQYRPRSSVPVCYAPKPTNLSCLLSALVPVPGQAMGDSYRLPLIVRASIPGKGVAVGSKSRTPSKGA